MSVWIIINPLFTVKLCQYCLGLLNNDCINLKQELDDDPGGRVLSLDFLNTFV